MEIFMHSETWIALLTLTFLEIVLGVDNIIFISIISNKLPEHQRAKARNIGLSAALLFRVALLLLIDFILGFTEPILTIFDFALSGRDIILFIGGLFLIFKSTTEIHHKMEGPAPETNNKSKAVSFMQIIAQIVALDIIFSFDSILTAVGLADEVLVMIIAVIIALIIMMTFAGKISAVINKHPTLQILALSFLILIGFMLVLDGLHRHVPKGYIYFAVFFSLIVEVVNIRIRKHPNPIQLNKRIDSTDTKESL